MLLLLLALLFAAGAVYLVADVATAGARERRTLVRRAARYGKLKLPTRPGHESFAERVLAPLKGKLAGWALRLSPRSTVDGVAAKLLLAGLARRMTPTTFLAFKAGAGIGGGRFRPPLGVSARPGRGAPFSPLFP